MSAPVPDTIPESPICRSADDETKPCEFAVHCVETRQRVQSGYRKAEGRWVQIGETLWGGLCWAYQQFRDRRASSSTEPVGSKRDNDDPPF